MAGNTLTDDPAWNVVTQPLNVGARSAVTSRAGAAIWSTLGLGAGSTGGKTARCRYFCLSELIATAGARFGLNAKIWNALVLVLVEEPKHFGHCSV